MKIRICLIVTAQMLISSCIFSQDLSGIIKYTVAHDWNKKQESNEFISKAQKEQSAYVWGTDNIYNGYANLKFSSEASIYENIDDQEDVGYTWRSDEYSIYRNRKENRMYDVIRTLNRLYVIDDTVRYQNWKIKNDMKEVAGHICMNAYYRDTIKDKDIIAWFALDMPLPYGPDIYGGLPGMILEVNMNNGAVVITATEITFSETKVEKPTHKKKNKAVSEAEFTQIIYKFVQESKKNKRPYFYSISY
ncbi:GLPGLI family protein [Bacteroidales bacterium OttesenSCG-928-I21]|nr:GLPGLI family protein [Bacteroidales bacterium OttesenSCG-928-I21]